jgi:hypothetical protein
MGRMEVTLILVPMMGDIGINMIVLIGYMTLQERVPSNEHTEGESGVFAQNAGEMVNGSVPILMTPISLQNFLPENASMGMIITIGIILLEMAI